MIRIFLMCFVAALVFSCKTDKLPSHVLPPERMESLMWDLIRAEQALSLPFNIDTTVNRTLKSKKVYQQVLILHKVSEEDFKKSFRFYQQNPVHLKPILDSLRVKQADTALVNKRPIQ